MHQNLYYCPLACCFAALLLAVPVKLFAAEGDNKRWVHGSWVNVRAAALPDSSVLAHITANTPVLLLKQHDKTCEIAWDKNQRGFVPCNLLGDKPLTLEETAYDALDEGKPNPQYSPPRAFWIAPSMDALFEAGKHFHKTLLKPKQLAVEGIDTYIPGGSPPNRLVRYLVPEFEAMKQAMAEGIIVGIDHDPPLLTCQQWQQWKSEERGRYIKNNQRMNSYFEKFPYIQDPMIGSCHHSDFPELRLPQISPSLFKNSKEIAPGNADTEQLSAHFGIVERGKVTGSPKWKIDHDSMRYDGAWDIGRYKLTLEKPLVQHVVDRSGLIGAYEWTPEIQVTPFEARDMNEECTEEGLVNKPAKGRLLKGYDEVKDALLWFHTERAMPYKKATIYHHKESSKDKNASVSVYEVDINNDRIVDFIHWLVFDIKKQPPEGVQRFIFVNINGAWYPFEDEWYSICE